MTVCRLRIYAFCFGLGLTVTPAWGQPTLDEFTLEVHGSDYATVSFYNAYPPSSFSHPAEMTNGALTVGIEVRMGPGPETIEVYPPEGWIAIPPFLDVIDGETGTVELRRGEYLGF